MTSDNRKRLVWLIGTRVVVSTLLMGSAIVFQVNAPGSLPIDPFFFLIGLTYCLSVIYAVTLPYVDRHPWLIAVQGLVDVVVVTAFIYFTGGITSYFQLLYVLPILGATAVRMQRGARQLALLSALLYGMLVLHQYSGGAGYIGGVFVGDVRPLLPPIRVAIFTVAANAMAFVAVAWLAGSLAERLASADDRLAVTSTALADLQAFNEHVIASLTSGLITTDRAGRIISLNRAAEQITGLPTAAARGRVAAEALQAPETFAAELSRDFGGAPSLRADYTYHAPNGRRVEIGLSAARLVTPDGPAGYLLTFQDVTEIRRLERDARKRQRLAAVGEMAAGIAHEIRNPLASMRGSIQVLRSELSLTDEQASLMDIVLRESDRLNDTIQSFLSYARPQAAVPQPVDLVRTLQEAATLLRNSPEIRAGHQVLVEGPAEGVIVDADDSQLRQVIWNLATNGLRAMPAGGTLRLQAQPPAVEREEPALVVADEGVGIPAEQLDTLFQPFHGSFGQGSGLGLAIVHRIVQDHRGEVAIESEVGRGTCVTVRLPAGRPVQAEVVSAD
jgi:two-component system sensor histidine kinase PilS (NtrC family)